MRSRSRPFPRARRGRASARGWYVLVLAQWIVALAMAAHPTWLQADTRGPDRADADVPTYAVVEAGDSALPSGIGEVCLVDDVLVAVVNRHWSFLDDAQRRASVEALEGGRAAF